MTIRTPILLLSIFLVQSSFGQLDFSGMSTKEKIRIAHEEEQASESDHVFRDLMQKGMSSFENYRFDEAEALFNQAANRRPVNVYPPVLIDDVKLAKMNFVEEEPELPVEKLEEYTSIEPELTAEQRVEAMYQQELQKVGLGLPPSQKRMSLVDLMKRKK